MEYFSSHSCVYRSDSIHLAIFLKSKKVWQIVAKYDILKIGNTFDDLLYHSTLTMVSVNSSKVLSFRKTLYRKIYFYIA
jgi:hypothetical protein